MSQDGVQLIMGELGKINGRLDKIEVRLDNIEIRLDNIEVRLENVEDRLAKVETEVSYLKSDVKELNVKFVKLEDDIQRVITDQGLLKAATLSNLNDITRMRFWMDHAGAAVS